MGKFGNKVLGSGLFRTGVEGDRVSHVQGEPEGHSIYRILQTGDADSRRAWHQRRSGIVQLENQRLQALLRRVSDLYFFKFRLCAIFG